MRRRAGSLTARFTGRAGSSFGAFAIRGMRLALEGEANDYVGKGLNGAEISVGPFAGRLNHEMVLLADLDAGNEQLLERLVRGHSHRTSAARARAILDGWGRGMGPWRKAKPCGAPELVAMIRQYWTERLASLIATTATLTHPITEQIVCPASTQPRA